jgi:hypothetical protein
VARLTNPISQPSLEMSGIWIPLIDEDVSKLQGSPTVLAASSCFISHPLSYWFGRFHFSTEGGSNRWNLYVPCSFPLFKTSVFIYVYAWFGSNC